MRDRRPFASHTLLSLAQLLDDPLLREAELLAAADRVPDRAVAWFSVIEQPVDGFVRNGDVVMTTAVGCDDTSFTALLREVLAGEPAGVLLALAASGTLERPPPEAIAAAELAGIPFVQIPWHVPFSEVARAIVDGLDRERRPGLAGSTAALAPTFVAALLGERGLPAIVEVAEREADAPVVIIGADLRVQAAGARATHQLGPALDAVAATVEAMSAGDVLAARDALVDPATAATALDRLGLPRGAVVAAESAKRDVGYVYAPEHRGDRKVLLQAAEAVALDQLRALAVAEADVRAQGDVLWGIARGDLHDPAEIARRADVFGYELDRRHHVAVGLVASGAATTHDQVTLDAVTLRSLRRHGLHASRADEGVLVVAPADGPPLERLLADAPGATWGVAEEAVTLVDLRRAYTRARAAAAAALALGRRGGVTTEAELGPYLLLARLEEDPTAAESVERVLGELLEYDERSGRDLAGTLAVYLAANGNASAAARDLHLNRHSLLYRLRKIESLTGRDLERPDDRFLLDMALRLWRVRSARLTPPGAGRTPPDR